MRRRTFALASFAAVFTDPFEAVARPALAAKPPAGFVPEKRPGKVVRVSKSGSLQDNGLWPKQEAATAMLARAMEELTGKSDVGQAFARFVHPDEKVAIKPNGIAGQNGATMAANKELVLAVANGLIAAGVKEENIVIYEQYPKFMAGTRVADRTMKLAAEFPQKIRAMVHENKDATMDDIEVYGIPTKFARPFTEATAVINITQIKDHNICGYTGAMKNITHGTILNPHAFHAHTASPQIAMLYAQDVVTSRVRLHVTDAFKVTYDGGPLDKKPEFRLKQEAIYVSTDPVAQDVVGWELVEKLRKENNLPSLKEAMREPLYIRVAADLGLGVGNRNAIVLRDVAI